ncbi:uncharacterized protein pkm [Drosophila takahashii]|uniref:uncharacterized protein pkm n=1 Tax=Drosophila takahashii TaxID=29030 RepID=UPI001CF8F73A|nr:uncharacterized protein LOC108066674 [Drosophila takahashii]
MEQPGENQLEAEEDPEKEQLTQEETDQEKDLQEYIENILHGDLERQGDEERPQKNSPENENENEENPAVQEELSGEESQRESILAKNQEILDEEPVEEEVLEKEELKEREELEEDTPGDQHSEEELKGKPEESVKREEELTEICENKERLTDTPESVENQEDHLTPQQNQENQESKPEEDLPNEQVTQFLRQLVSREWPEVGALPELRLQRASAKGDNYLGVVWRMQVAPGDSQRSLVVKLPPQNRVRRKQFFARPCFLRETAAYEEFLPLAEMIQEKWSIPAEDRFRQHALCLGTRQDEPNECIVLEDLACSGFSLHNRFHDLSLEQVRQVIRTYAKLHAISLAAKRQFPDRMHKLQLLVDIFEQRREDHALGVYFENLKGSALSALLSTPADDRYRRRLESYFSRGSYFELLLPLVGGSNCEPFAVICHGDCWNNNILYKSSEGGVLEDVRLIDWQLMRYASPVTDLAYFLFTCTSRDFRQRHLKNILEDYYEELGVQLKRLGEQLDQLLPRSAFDEQVATKAPVGLLLAMMVLPIVTMQGQDVPDLQAISERIEAGATTDLQGAGFLGAGNEATFKQRMREVILDCVDFDYI